MEEKKDHPEEFNKKGLEYLERNLPGKAIEYFDKAIRLNDKNPTYWNNKGNYEFIFKFYIFIKITLSRYCL